MHTEIILNFAKIIILENDVAEIIVNESIEMNLTHIKNMRDVLKENLSSPIYLIINKINHYSYDFESQVEIGNFIELKATAIICYSETTRQTTQFVSKIKTNKNWNMEIFSNKAEALNWIKHQKTTAII